MSRAAIAVGTLGLCSIAACCPPPIAAPPPAPPPPPPTESAEAPPIPLADPPRTHRTDPLLCARFGMACVFAELDAPGRDFRARLAPGGGLEKPRIPVSIVIHNDGKSAWSCTLGELMIHVEGERSKRVQNRALPPPAMPIGCRIDRRESRTLTVEMGDLLTEIAAGYTKGDVLSIKALLTLESADDEEGTLVETPALRVAVFVPEG